VGGVLWFEPTIDTQTELDRSDLPDDILAEVESNRSFVSSASARKYLDFLKIALVDPATSTTTTTTTPATTTTAGG
jgi:hypothetical protein